MNFKVGDKVRITNVNIYWDGTVLTLIEFVNGTYWLGKKKSGSFVEIFEHDMTIITPLEELL